MTACTGQLTENEYDAIIDFIIDNGIVDSIDNESSRGAGEGEVVKYLFDGTIGSETYSMVLEQSRRDQGDGSREYRLRWNDDDNGTWTEIILKLESDCTVSLDRTRTGQITNSGASSTGSNHSTVPDDPTEKTPNADSGKEANENPNTEETTVNNSLENISNTMIQITIGSQSVYADFADNSSAEAFHDLLLDGPLTVEMHDYGNFEKVGDIGTSLPENNEQITTEPGDIILYQGNNITIYYDTNSWNFTRLGKIDPSVSPEELIEFLGDGDVTVTFSLAAKNG